MQGYLIYANKIHFNPYVELQGMRVYGGEIEIPSGNLRTDENTELRYTIRFRNGGNSTRIANPKYYTQSDEPNSCDGVNICNTFSYDANSVSEVYRNGAWERVTYGGGCPSPTPDCVAKKLEVTIPPIGDLYWTGTTPSGEVLDGDSTSPMSTYTIHVPVNQSQTVTAVPSPRRYGQLKLEDRATLYMNISAGEYYFNTVNVGVGGEIVFNVTKPTDMDPKDFKLYIYIYDTFYMAQGSASQDRSFNLNLPEGISPTQCIIYVNSGNATIAEYGTCEGYLIVPNGYIRLDDVNGASPEDPTAHLVAKEVWIGSRYKFIGGNISS
jgi:hypothetical protein